MTQSAPRAMPVNPGWYVVAVQAMVVLCRSGEVCPSNMLAERVGAHAVFIRRILAQLARAGLVEAREGRIGGYQLVRQPSQVLLGDVYRALQMGPHEAIEAAERGPMIEPHVRYALATIYQEAEQFFIKTLDTHTLADVINAPLPAHAEDCLSHQSALDKITD